MRTSRVVAMLQLRMWSDEGKFVRRAGCVIRRIYVCSDVNIGNICC